SRVVGRCRAGLSPPVAGRGGDEPRAWGGKPVRRALTFGFGGAAAGYVARRFLGRTAGSTRAERRARLAGDAMVHRPQIVTDHGIDIPAPTSQVWPWLTQMGWHLGGYYTPAWVDRWLF